MKFQLFIQIFMVLLYHANLYKIYLPIDAKDPTEDIQVALTWIDYIQVDIYMP